MLRLGGHGPRVFGYARVSARDQNLARQFDALRLFPVDEQMIYADRASGKDFNRPAYQRLMGKLRAGDVLVVKSIDRLGRSYEEILEQWRIITRQKGCSIVVLDMPLLDTRTAQDSLTGAFVADIVLQLLSYVAQVERENIKQRQREGIAAARARGVRFGRPPKARPSGYEEVQSCVRANKLSKRAAAKKLDVSVATLNKWIAEDEGKA